MTARWSCIEGPTATALLRDGGSVCWIRGRDHATWAAEIVERMNTADDVRLTDADARLVLGWLGSIERAIANSTYPWSDDVARVKALLFDQLKEPE